MNTAELGAATTLETSKESKEESKAAIDLTPINEAIQKVLEAAAEMRKPRKRTLVRGPDGKATGSIEEDA